MSKYVFQANVKQDFIMDYKLNKIFLEWYSTTKKCQECESIHFYNTLLPVHNSYFHVITTVYEEVLK
jgi:hypothetical protein